MYSDVIVVVAAIDKTIYCDVQLTENKYQAFVYAVKNHYWYQMYIDDLPIWGKFHLAPFTTILFSQVQIPVLLYVNQFLLIFSEPECARGGPIYLPEINISPQSA